MTAAGRAPRPVPDHPRPPALRAAPGLPAEACSGAELPASTGRAVPIPATGYPPLRHLPFDDVATGLLAPGDVPSTCEWKGLARYRDLLVGERRARAPGTRGR